MTLVLKMDSVALLTTMGLAELQAFFFYRVLEPLMMGNKRRASSGSVHPVGIYKRYPTLTS